MAFLAWGLLWLGAEAGGLVWLGLGLLALLVSGSAGGLLAMLLGGAGYAWSKWRPDRLTTVSGLLVLAVLVFVLLAGQANDSGSWDNRLLIYQHAGRGIVAAPLLGHGADAYRLVVGTWLALDEHNLALTILHETGLAGAVVAAWGLVWLVKRHEFAPWQVGFLACFAGHSMVDGPLFASFFAGVVLMLVLGGLHKKKPPLLEGE